jgi:signal transduction histidine kinase
MNRRDLDEYVRALVRRARASHDIVWIEDYADLRERMRDRGPDRAGPVEAPRPAEPRRRAIVRRFPSGQGRVEKARVMGEDRNRERRAPAPRPAGSGGAAARRPRAARPRGTMGERASGDRTVGRQSARSPTSVGAPQRVEEHVATLDLVARSLTHELRQPLAGIIGYADLLAAGGRDKPLAAHGLDDVALLDRIRGAAWSMAVALEKLERAPELPLIALGPQGRWRVLDLRARPASEDQKPEPR